jgi:hypothetical protein
MNIAFIFIAEAYQVYHAAAIAFDLMARKNVTVTFYYNDPETPHHLDRARRACGLPPIDLVRLRRGPVARAIQATRLLGLAKEQVLRDNDAVLARYDAIVSLEDAAEILFGDRPEGERPARILIVHGAGDRMVPSMPRRRRFDLIVFQGEKMAHRAIAEGWARAGHVASPGYAKLALARRLAAASSPFDGTRKIVLYNPHKAARLGSWTRFAEAMIASFAAQSEFDLIVAPHVKLMRRRSQRFRDGWRARSTPHILIDPGSDRSVDMSYTDAADIYVGDVSSQVYEFVARPRPCVFLNPGRIAWRGDRHFLAWEMGEVIEDPAEVMAAIRRAPARHGAFVERQRDLAAASLGDVSSEAPRRAADAILAYLATRERPA